LRDGQSFALAGLLDNNETQSLSKVPGLGDIPILGNLFRSKTFQKNESELMFIVTAQMVKPVNRDDLPRMPNVENLKNGSLLGVEPKSGELKGPTGFIINPGSGQGESATPKPMQPVVPTKTETPTIAPAAGGSTKGAVIGASAAVPTPETKNPNQ
jgi:pilus assembly protein CpaC